MLFIFILLISYILVTGVLFNHLLKPRQPDFSNYFSPNQKFVSQMEGLSLIVKKVENNWAYCRAELNAFAAQGNDFDTWDSKIPLGVQKALRWILGPTARLLGHRK